MLTRIERRLWWVIGLCPIGLALCAFGAPSGAVNDPFTTIAELNTGIAAASCGDTIYILTNTYSSGTITLNKTCTSGNYLTVSVSDGTAKALGGAVFSGSTKCYFTGSYQTVEGFDFVNNTVAAVAMENGATYNIVRHCRFTDVLYSDGAVNIGKASSNNTHNQISYCHFRDTGTWGGFCIWVRATTAEGYIGNTHTLIDHNWFEDHANPSGYETIYNGDGTGTAGEPELPYYTLIEYNFFDNCSSDPEIIKIGVSDNIIRFNTVTGGDGCLSLRMGNRNIVEGNFMELLNADTSNFRGIRVQGIDNVVRNNYILGHGGYSSIIIHGGKADKNLSQEATRTIVANNTVKNPNANNGFIFNMDNGSTVSPVDTLFINNLAECAIASNGAFGFGYTGTGHVWTSNRGHVASGSLTAGGASATDSGGYELTQLKTGLSLNWYYPASYTAGTDASAYGVLTDIQGQRRVSWSIGCDETGAGQDLTEKVGPSWDTQGDIQVPLSTRGLMQTRTLRVGTIVSP